MDATEPLTDTLTPQDLAGCRLVNKHRVDVHCSCNIRLDRWVRQDLRLKDGTIRRGFSVTNGEFPGAWARHGETYADFVGDGTLRHIFDSADLIAYRCGNCGAVWRHDRSDLTRAVFDASWDGVDRLREPIAT